MLVLGQKKAEGWKYKDTYPLTDHSTSINLSGLDFDEVCVFVKVGTLNSYNQYTIPKSFFTQMNNSYVRNGSDTYNTTFKVTNGYILTSFYVTYAGSDVTSSADVIVYYRME